MEAAKNEQDLAKRVTDVERRLKNEIDEVTKDATKNTGELKNNLYEVAASHVRLLDGLATLGSVLAAISLISWVFSLVFS